MRTHTLLALFVATLLAPPARAASDDGFWTFWGDGKAELDGYALTQPRYGEKRDGTAVMIFVTEDFSDSLRVKADPDKHPKSDVYPVLKLNFVRDFQTGIYDYNILTSTFVRTETPPGAPVPWPLAKVSFSSQEWCGHVYQEWIPRPSKAGGVQLVGILHSYFDGEADQQLTLPLPDSGVSEDAAPILVRGLRGAWLERGASKTVPWLFSSLRARLEHKPQAWGEATVSRSKEPVQVRSVLGTVAADVYKIEEKDGPTVTWTVEAAAPHRILAWESTSGESGKLTGSQRLPYWQLHQQGGEANLKALGLTPMVPAKKPK